MLTKSDLSQIQKIVQTVTLQVVQSETRKIVLEEATKIIQSETRKIVQEEFKPVKQDIRKIKSDINLIVHTFDKDYVVLRRRVDRIEEHLQLAPMASS